TSNSASESVSSSDVDSVSDESSDSDESTSEQESDSSTDTYKGSEEIGCPLQPYPSNIGVKVGSSEAISSTPEKQKYKLAPLLTLNIDLVHIQSDKKFHTASGNDLKSIIGPRV